MGKWTVGLWGERGVEDITLGLAQVAINYCAEVVTEVPLVTIPLPLALTISCQ